MKNKIISLVICIALTISAFAFGAYAVTCPTGDVNGSNAVTIEDAVLLAQYLAGWRVEINGLLADCTGDGIVDIADAVILAQYLADWNVIFGSENPYRYIKDIDLPIDDVYYGEYD